MLIEIQFAGYEPIQVNTENGTCGVFEKLTATEAAAALENAAMGDADENGWIAAQIGGEDCVIRCVREFTGWQR